MELLFFDLSTQKCVHGLPFLEDLVAFKKAQLLLQI